MTTRRSCEKWNFLGLSRFCVSLQILANVEILVRTNLTSDAPTVGLGRFDSLKDKLQRWAKAQCLAECARSWMNDSRKHQSLSNLATDI
jgi:hypothetical protein